MGVSLKLEDCEILPSSEKVTVMKEFEEKVNEY